MAYLLLERPARQHDAVHRDGGDRHDVQHAHVDVGNVEGDGAPEDVQACGPHGTTAVMISAGTTVTIGARKKMQLIGAGPA